MREDEWTDVDQAEEEVELKEAEQTGEGLEPDDAPEAGLSGDLSDENPEGREQRSPPPETEEVDEDGDD